MAFLIKKRFSTVTLIGFAVGFTVLLPVVTEAALPHADFVFSPQQPEEGQEVTFDPRGYTVDTDNDYDTLSWRFETRPGSNQFAGTDAFSVTPVAHTFQEAGSFRVRLTVTDDAGNSDVEEKEIIVVERNTPPDGALTCEDDVVEMEVRCNAYGFLDAEGDDLTYTWKIDGEIQANRNGTAEVFSFTQSREYDIEVVVTDSHGAAGQDMYKADLRSTDASVTPKAEFTFSPMSPKVGEKIDFDAAVSVVGDQKPVKYQWTWGDTDPKFIKNDETKAFHTYNAPADYVVRLDIIVDGRVIASKSKTITILPVSDGRGDDGNGGGGSDGGGQSSTRSAYDPATDYGGGGLVPCNGIDCEFDDLIELANRVIDFMIILAGLVAVVMFVYAGWLYIASQGDTSKVAKAHGIFKKTAIGLIVVLLAWLIVDNILDALLTGQGFWSILG